MPCEIRALNRAGCSAVKLNSAVGGYTRRRAAAQQVQRVDRLAAFFLPVAGFLRAALRRDVRVVEGRDFRLRLADGFRRAFFFTRSGS